MKLFQLTIIDKKVPKEKYVSFYTETIELLVLADSEEAARLFVLNSAIEEIDHKELFADKNVADCQEIALDKAAIVYAYTGTG